MPLDPSILDSIPAPTGDPVDDHLTAARDALKDRLTDLANREVELRNELDQVIGDRTRTTGRIADLDNILTPKQPARPASVPTPAAGMARAAAEAAKVAAPAKKTRTAAAAAASSGVRGDQAKARWLPVFEWVTASKADGSYTIAGLTHRFGSWAKNWAAAARKYGVTIPNPPTPPQHAGRAGTRTGRPGRTVDVRAAAAGASVVGRRSRPTAPRVHRMPCHLPPGPRRTPEQPLPAVPRPRRQHHRTHTHPGR